jgi:NAD+ synthase (glutamine-hydrolysing)
VALSGGKDSVLTLVLAWLYMKRRAESLPEADRAGFIRESIQCFSMPTRFNSATTRGISSGLCEELGVTFTEQSIEEAFAREAEAAKAMLPPGQELPPVALQNIQARIRGQRMWNWSNATGGCWLQTGNMSEMAVGYTTVGGDLMGAYSLIGNLPKTVIIELLRFIAEEYGWQGVKDVLETKASAELAEGQEDEKDLMPFPVLDACIALYAGEKLDEQEMLLVLQTCFPEHAPEQLATWVSKFVWLFHRSVFKWVQAPETVHLGSLRLDRERALQIPVVQSDEWLHQQQA